METQIYELIINQKKSSGEIKELLSLNRRQLKRIAKKLGIWKNLVQNTRNFTNQNLNNPERRNRKIQDHINCLPVEDIYSDILNGLGMADLIEKYKIGPKEPSFVAKIKGCTDILRKNSRIRKSERSRRAGDIRRKLKDDTVIGKFGDQLIDMVNNGLHREEIKRSLPINIPANVLTRVFDKLGLLEQLKQNFIRVRKELQYKRALKGASKMRGVKRPRPITIEMENFYINLVSQKEKDGPGRKAFHTKFKTSGDSIWVGLQKKYGILEKNPNRFQSGDKNPMYHKEPHYLSGSGVHGKILICPDKKVYFRSSLELFVFLYLIYNGVQFKLSNHKVRYFFNNKWRTYYQDIIIDNIIYEIKPTVKIHWEVNICKFTALQEYCNKFNLHCEYITEKTYDLSGVARMELVDELMQNKILEINEKDYNRLVKYIHIYNKKN